jgi:hypothetical protein
LKEYQPQMNRIDTDREEKKQIPMFRAGKMAAAWAILLSIRVHPVDRGCFSPSRVTLMKNVDLQRRGFW